MGKEPSGLNAWTTPSSLLGIFGFAALVFAGYNEFQDDTVKDIAVLEEKVRNLERDIDGLQRDQRDNEDRRK